MFSNYIRLVCYRLKCLYSSLNVNFNPYLTVGVKSLPFNYKTMDYVIITNRFWIEFEVTREQANIYVKQWDIKPYDVREKWEIKKEVVEIIEPIIETPVIKEEVKSIKLDDLTIEQLREEYKEAFWKEVSNNMKNNADYIKKQLLSLIK